MPKRLDLAGLVTEGHTVVSFAGRDKHGAATWECKCHRCGRVYIARSGDANSRRPCGPCGIARSNIARMTKHGLSGGLRARHPMYKTWMGVKKRCFNANDAQWPNYGGRGIQMYEPWVTDAGAFVEYVTSLPGYGEEGHSLDRINNDGNYEPGNLRWATQREQSLNTSRNRYVTHNGETRTLSEWAKITGLGQTFLDRFYKLGATGDKLFNPVKYQYKLYEWRGERKTLKEWAELTGVKYATLLYRVKHGKPMLNLKERT